MKKFLAVACVVVAGIFAGCGLDPLSNDDSVSITLTDITTITAGSNAVNVEGDIDANAVVETVTYQILDSNGAVVPDTKIKVNFNTLPADKEDLDFQTDLGVSIQVLTAACNGTYKFKTTAVAGSASTSKDFEFDVTGGSCTGGPSALVTDTVELGGHSNTTLGSSVDLDDGTIKLAGSAVLANSGIDIVYTYSGVVNSPVLLTPQFAKDSSGITAFATWVSPNNTQFHKVTANFNSITTASQIQALFNASTAFQGRLPVAANDLIVVKTDENAYVLLQMMTVSTTAAGTAQIKYVK